MARNKIPVMVYLDPDAVQPLKDWAKIHSISMSAAIAQLMQLGLRGGHCKLCSPSD